MFGLLWFKDGNYIGAILGSDSFKKRVLKKFLSLNSRFLDATGFFKVKSGDIHRIIDEMDIKLEQVNAVYLNLRRRPNRLYIWFIDSSGRTVFVKVFEPSEKINVMDEIHAQKKISAEMPSLNTFEVLNYGSLNDGSTFVIYESLEITLLSLRRAVSDVEVNQYFKKIRVLHPDLNSENIFAINDSFYAVDFEVIK
jgi:hypothetical protein